MSRPRNLALACPVVVMVALQACDAVEPVGAPIAIPDGGRDATWVVGDSSSPSAPGDGGGDAGPPARSEVAVGGTFACVLAKDRTVWCWGKNDAGQLGRDPSATPSCGSSPCSPVPTKIEGLANVARLALGDDFGCALDLAGSVHCWGSNAKGQLGRKDVQSSFEPVLVIVRVTDVTAAGAHACALTNDGLVYCWGENTCEIFGKTGSIQSVAQVLLPQMAQISVGPDAMCATRTDGRVLCWGADHRGSLGHDVPPGAGECNGVPFDPVPKTVQVNDSDIPITLVSDVHVGTGVACARHTNGKVVCWGDNERGALGQGFPDPLPHPRAVEVPAMFAERLEVSGQTPCVIVADRVMCWGDGRFGQLDSLAGEPGCAGQTCRPLAHAIPGMMPARGLAAGPGSIAVIKDDLTVWMWGRNDFSELALPKDDPANVACGGSLCVPQPRQLTGLPPLD